MIDFEACLGIHYDIKVLRFDLPLRAAFLLELSGFDCAQSSFLCIRLCIQVISTQERLVEAESCFLERPSQEIARLGMLY
jgi:hypothetical protein